jgi:hypothetical protein
MQISPSIDPVFAPIIGCFTHDVAARILEIRLDELTQEKMDNWAKQANEGLLSEVDRVEYERLIDKLDTLGLLKSLARQALKNSA